jgi:DinB superfamily
MTSLAYPIGQFDLTRPFTEADRAAAVSDIAALPARFRAAVAGLTEAQLDTPYRPGGWTVRQVAHHVPDSHLNAYTRFKLALTENEPLIKTYEEAQWAELPDSTLPVEPSLALLENLHLRWTYLLEHLTDAQWQRTLRHPALGLVKLHPYVGLYAWHGRHHLAHVEQLRTREGWGR